VGTTEVPTNGGAITAEKRRHVAWEQLGAREREILEVLFARGEATVAEVRERLKSPPSYSAVRGMLGLLEQKGYAKHRRDGLRYVYAASVSATSARSTAMRKLIDTFFGGSPAKAVATLLKLPDETADDVTIAELRRAVLAAREEGR
jgi:predicted transcriptional regulator